MPALPLTATQQAPLQSLFASSPFDIIPDQPSRRNSLSVTVSRPRSASVSQSSSSTITCTSAPPSSLSSVRRASASAASATAIPPPTPLASLSFTAEGQCQSVTIPNATAQAIQFHITTTERKSLRARGFRLPDVKSKLTVPARSERPLVVVWDGRRDVENLDEAGPTMVHELRLEQSHQTSMAVVIRLSATLATPTATTAVTASAVSSARSAQRRPLRKLTDWLSNGFGFASPQPEDKADVFSAPKKSRSARRHSTSVTATHSTASCSGSTPHSLSVDDEWSSPRHASEPPVHSPLRHQHCYTLSAADVYTLSQDISGSGRLGSDSGSPSQPARKLSSEHHSRSFSTPVQSWQATTAANC